ncbi:unnamed protein product [Merluccius merluccius]
MTTAVASPFFDFDVMNKNNKLLGYSNNNNNNTSSMGSPHTMMPTPTGTLLDRKAVGTPSSTTTTTSSSTSLSSSVYQRRHSVSSSTKFNQNQFLNSLKASDHALLISGVANNNNGGGGGGGGSNKENRMRDRSFSETGERLLHKCLGPASPLGTGGGNGGGQVNSSRYKTELCRPFEENGACKYGDKCQFAHGMHELRSLSRHPKYKTELCRTFHTIGFCPYGPRCHFIHNAEERRGPPPSSSSSSSSSSSPLSSSNHHHHHHKLERPRLQHSYSFAGFSSGSGGRRDSPTSVTPPPMFFPDELPEWPSSNPFTYSSQELAQLFGPSLGSSSSSGGGSGESAPPQHQHHHSHSHHHHSHHQAPPSPTGAPYFFRPMAESPPPFETPSSPPDSLSDQDGYQSSSGGSLSGSESPTLDTTRRLPIFSRLSISDD